MGLQRVRDNLVTKQQQKWGRIRVGTGQTEGRPISLLLAGRFFPTEETTLWYS